MEAGSLDPANVIDELRAELMAIEPSPGFATGVRQRIAARGGVWTRVTLSLAFATTAVVLVTGAASWLNGRDASSPAGMGPVAMADARPVAPEPVSKPVRTSPTRRASASVKPASVAVAQAPAGPFLEVITNQPAIIRGIWAGIEGGVARIGLPANGFEEITVAPVRVDAILVPKIGPPGGGGLVPEARRVTGESSARGDQQ
jgi:hypothetical protein